MKNKNKKKKSVTELYEELKEQTYWNHYLVDVENVKSYEEELYALGEELPNIIISFLPHYYTMLEKNKIQNNKNTLKKREYSHEESTIEFIDWINTHKEFKDILNKKELEKLEKELKELEKTFNETLNCLT